MKISEELKDLTRRVYDLISDDYQNPEENIIVNIKFLPYDECCVSIKDEFGDYCYDNLFEDFQITGASLVDAINALKEVLDNKENQVNDCKCCKCKLTHSCGKSRAKNLDFCRGPA